MAAGGCLQWLTETSWRVISCVITATLMACTGVVIAFSGPSQKARASVSPAGYATVISAHPAERDRILVGLDGDLRQALFRAAVAPGDIDRILAEAKRASGSDRIQPGASVELVFVGRTTDDAYRSLYSASFSPAFGVALEVKRDKGQLVGGVSQIPIDHTPLRVQGLFGQDAHASLLAVGIPASMVDEYMRVLAEHVDTSTIAPGDQYDVIVERDTTATGQVRFGGLMYAGLRQASGISLQLSQWTLGNKLRWFDAEEAANSRDNIQRPVPGVVSSNYGARLHPILGYTRMHKGIDFKAGYGTPILAVQTGWVSHAGWAGGHGKRVELTHGAGMSTVYSHMSQIVAQAGTLVQQGQVIGYVGSTGLATGPHLHYELHQNGVPIDPATVQFTVGPQLRGRDLEGYQARLQALLTVPVSRSQIKTAWLN